FEHLGHGDFEHVAAGTLALRQRGRRDAMGGGGRQARRGRPGGEHAHDFGGLIRRLRGIDQRAHVAAPTGKQDGDLPADPSPSLPRKVTGSPDRSVSRPTMAAVSPEAARLSTSLSASAGATATSMPTPQLKVRSISRSFMPPVLASQPNTPGTVMAPRSISAAR